MNYCKDCYYYRIEDVKFDVGKCSKVVNSYVHGTTQGQPCYDSKAKMSSYDVWMDGIK